MTLRLDLKGFQGVIRKDATVFSDDPTTPRLTLLVHGRVKALIEVRPEKVVLFQGMADQFIDKSVDILSTLQSFHIRKVEDDLKQRTAYRLETVEEGKHYRLLISNRLQRGAYRGSITLHTDLANKPEVTVWVNGSIEGEIGIRPTTLLLGRLTAGKPVVSGKVLVTNNRSKPFRILKCTYDEKLVHVTPTPFPDETGYSLEVVPDTKNIPPGGRIKTTLSIETDVASEGRLEVQIQLLNLTDAPASSKSSISVESTNAAPPSRE